MMQKSSLTLAAALAGSLALGAQGAVIYGVGSNGTSEGQGLSYTAWDVFVVDNATTYTSGDIAGVVDGVNFTYTITAAAVSNGGDNLTADLVGETILRSAGAEFADGESYSITINITGDDSGTLDVVFDGFTRFVFNQTGGGEGAEVNGLTYLRNDGSADVNNPAFPAWDFAGAPINGSATGGTVTIESIGTTTTRLVDFQFSTVPEPGSLALIGLGGLFVLRRRRD